MSARHSWVQAVPMDGENGENAILFVVNYLVNAILLGFFLCSRQISCHACAQIFAA